jgi:hypothetical protein
MPLVRSIVTSLGVFRKQCRHLLQSLASIDAGEDTKVLASSATGLDRALSVARPLRCIERPCGAREGNDRLGGREILALHLNVVTTCQLQSFEVFSVSVSP